MTTTSSTEAVQDSGHDTVRIPALAELQRRFLGELGFDPYQSSGEQAFAGQRAPRRTLDDMRRLSEAIKRARVRSAGPG